MLLGLKMVRKNKALSQANAAKELGFSRQVFCNYENGKRAPSYDTLSKMSDFFNVSIHYLITGKEFSYARPSIEEHAHEIVDVLIEIGYIKPNEDISREKKDALLDFILKNKDFISARADEIRKGKDGVLIVEQPISNKDED